LPFAQLPKPPQRGETLRWSRVKWRKKRFITMSWTTN